MATRQATVDFILEQLARVEGVDARKMFGEYGLYAQGKMVGLICDDQLFLKMSVEGRALAPDLDEAPPYAGAKPAMLIEGDRIENADWLTRLVDVTAAALPTPKPKASAEAKRSKGARS